jgi:hypothetical protein
MMDNNKKSFITRAFEDMKEDAAAQHEIDKASFAAVKADTKARFEQASAPDPDFEEFKAAKGFAAKAGVIAEHARRDAKETRAQSRADYEEVLKKQREKY